MNVPLLDLKAQYRSIKAEVEAAVAAVFESQYFINGPEVSRCEAAIAEYCGVGCATGVSSGTDAMLLCLMVEGIGRGDEVIVPDYSFFATAGSVVRVGARPVFVDIDPVTFNIDPDRLEAAVTPRTKAIMPVHLYGQMADMATVMAVADKYHLLVIEDAAQAIGAENAGMKAGSVGTYGCFSFFPSKNLGAAGDGGIVITNDPSRDMKMKVYRNHGAKPKYYHKVIGGNFRLDTLQAAVVLAKLPHLDDWSRARKGNAERYRSLFRDKGLLTGGQVGLPEDVVDRHIYNQFVIRVQRRDELKEFLKEKNIGTEVYYPVPFHLQECFVEIGCGEGDFPESERAARGTLALPIYPELLDEQTEYVVDSIAEFYQG